MTKSKLRAQLGLTERERAASGPRALKSPGSPEWCWQTIDMLVNHYKYVEEDYGKVADTLAELAQYQAWRIVPPDHPYGSVDAMLRAELGIGIKTVRERIVEASLGTRGGDRRSEKAKDQPDNISLKGYGTSRAYILARLERDGHAELAAKVRAGKISANAAAIKAGFRKPPKSPFEQISKLLPKLTRSKLRQLKSRIERALDKTPNERPKRLI